MFRLAPLLLLLSANFGCRTHSLPATAPSGAEVAEVAEAERECDAYKVETLRKAFALHVGQALPIRFEVDDRSGIHLVYDATTLSVDTAKLLATWQGPAWATRLTLDLSMIRSLDTATAEALATWGVSGEEFSLALNLDGLETLSVETSKALSAWSGSRWNAEDGEITWDYYTPSSLVRLSLDGITSLEAKAMRHLLFTWPHVRLGSAMHLSLNGLLVVPNDGLTQARPHKGDFYLALDGVSELSEAAATLVSTWPLTELSLAGLQSISSRTAARLLSWKARDLIAEKKITAEFHRNQANESEDDFAAEEEDYEPPTLEEMLAEIYERKIGRIILRSLQPESQRRLQSWQGLRRFSFTGTDHEEQGAERSSGCDLEQADSEALAKLAKAGAGDEQGEEWEILWQWAGVPPEELFPAIFKAEPMVSNDAEGHVVLPAQAAVDAKLIGELNRNGVTGVVSEAEALSPKSARVLAGWQGSELYLNSLKTLTKETASALAAWKGEKIELDGLTSLSPGVAGKLAQWPGDKLELDGVTDLPRLSAQQLAKWKGSKLELDSLRTVSVAAAKALAKWPGQELQLDGIQVLDKSALNALLAAKSKVSWNGSPISSDKTLGGVTVADKFSSQLAKAMKLPKSTYTFHWLTDLRIKASALSAKQAQVIVGLPDVTSIEFSSLTTLSPSAAAVLATWKGRELDLSSLTTLDAATALALANSACSEIKLAGLRTIDETTARALAAWKGDYLDLSGLETLSRKGVRIIRKRNGELTWLRYSVLVAPAQAIRLSADTHKDVIGFKNAQDLETDEPSRRLEWLLTP